MTPRKVTGIANKDTGDDGGDLFFTLLSAVKASECAAPNPPPWAGCFLNGDNIFIKSTVAVDGRWGTCVPTQALPYHRLLSIMVYRHIASLPISFLANPSSRLLPGQFGRFSFRALRIVSETPSLAHAQPLSLSLTLPSLFQMTRILYDSPDSHEFCIYGAFV
jgi:hypothetical protein